MSRIFVEVLLCILMSVSTVNSINNKGKRIVYMPSEKLCGYFDYLKNCVCKGHMQKSCDACEGVGLLGQTCTTDCGVNKYTQFGLCVEACDAQYSRFGASCVTECPHGTYQSSEDSGSVCQPCHQECNGCYGPSPNECDKCKHFLSVNNKCVDECSDGHAIFAQECIPMSLCPWVVSNGKCVHYCPSNMYQMANKVCQKCDAQCDGCTGPGNDKCKKCTGLSYEKNGTCVHSCPKTSPFQKDKQCVKMCASEDVVYNKTCLPSCPGSLFQQGNICVVACPDEQYIKDKQCVADCSQVTYRRQCLEKCPPKMFQFNQTCVSQCPKSAPFEEEDECTPKCSKFTYNRKCFDSCPGFTVWYNNICIHKCPVHYPISDPKTRECKGKCDYYHFAGKCVLTCPHSLYKMNHSCVHSCPLESMFLHNGTCIKDCHPPLRVLYKYDEKDIKRLCELECLSGTVEYKGTCIPQCPNDTFEYGRKCVSNCPDHMYHVDRHCIKNCREENVLLPGRDGSATCVQRCPEEKPFQFNKVCVRNCTVRGNDSKEIRWYIDENGYDCVPFCKRFTIEDEMKCSHDCQNMMQFHKTCVRRCPDGGPFVGYIPRNEGVTVCRPIDLKKAGVDFLKSISILIFFVTLSTVIVKVLSLVLRMNSTTIRDLLSEIETHNGHEVVHHSCSNDTNQPAAQESTSQSSNVSQSASLDQDSGGFQYDVFFSQSSDDSEWVENALDALESEPYNLRCCYSQRDFVPGKSILDNIENCISNSKCTVVLLSPSYMESEWCKKEQILATTNTIMKPDTLVIPVLLKPFDLPMSLNTINYIDAEEGNVYEKIVTAVNSAGQKKTYTPFSQLQHAITSVFIQNIVQVFIPLQDKDIYQAVHENYELKTVMSRVEVPMHVLYLAVKVLASRPLSEKREFRWYYIGSNIRCLIGFFCLPPAAGLLTCSVMALQGAELSFLSYLAIIITGLGGFSIFMPLTNLICHVLGTSRQKGYSRMKINSPKRATNEIVNWILNEKFALLIMWDYMKCGCMLMTYDSRPCLKYIKNKDELILLHDNDVDVKETSVLKGLLYEYVVQLRKGGVPNTSNCRHGKEKHMCFCQFAEYWCSKDRSVFSSVPKQRTRRMGSKTYEKLDDSAEIV